MKTTTVELADVSARISRLTDDKLDGIVLLPANIFETENWARLVNESTTNTVAKLFDERNIPASRLSRRGEVPPERMRRYADWVGPILFFPAALLSENPHLLNLSLGVLSNYVTEFFKGAAGPKSVKLTVVVERTTNGDYTSVQYDGPPDGLPELAKVIESARNGNTEGDQ